VEFYSAPNTPEILVYKVYAVLSLGFAARGADVFLVPFAAVSKLTDHAKNEDYYKVHFKRSKQRGYVFEANTFCVISGTMEVEILDTYMALFTEQNKLDEPRFFRKLKLNSKGQIAATKEKIGQHTAENIGKAVAGILRLLNPGDFTGHCWRRTAATLMAESGLVSSNFNCFYSSNYYICIVI